MRETRELTRIMARLRGPRGCPWDRRQTHRSLRPMILEEVYELLEAIDQGDDHALREELGDVLLHILFHAQLARERKAFDFGAVARASQVLRRWHQLKQQEKPSRQSCLDGIPRHLPALLYAQNLQRRASRAGFDWPDPRKGVPAKIHEEIRELVRAGSSKAAFTAEFGDLLFSLVNLARHRKIDAESALRDASRKFSRRVRTVESLAARLGSPTSSMSSRQLDKLWRQAKKK
ncbi:MAG: nucleoside triphosphate pyrophosphohydrolase [Verrucomicrobia bacterium]|nr:nucleoside triphosphate pyrophosphohydrolase [Verrucomicrobiota bacterium]